MLIFWISLNTKERVDDAALRIIAAMYKVNLIPDKYDESKAYPKGVNLNKNTFTDSILSISRKAARENFDLLKNHNITTWNNKINSAP